MQLQEGPAAAASCLEQRMVVAVATAAWAAAAQRAGQALVGSQGSNCADLLADPVAAVVRWHQQQQHAACHAAPTALLVAWHCLLLAAAYV